MLFFFFSPRIGRGEPGVKPCVSHPFESLIDVFCFGFLPNQTVKCLTLVCLLLF